MPSQPKRRKQKPPRKQRNPKDRTHIPALKVPELEAMMARLQQAQQIAGIPQEAIKAVEDILKAASNPQAESVDSAIRSLDSERQQNVRTGIAEVASVFAGVSQRASTALLSQFSGDDFNRMIEESLEEN